MTQRDLALVFYRNNLHGIGWKVETGRFAEALAVLDGYIKDLVKARDFAAAVEFKGHKAQIQAWRRPMRRAA